MGWSGHLSLTYRAEGLRTVGHDLHHGPLRVLQSLYPEGPTVCHHVLVHPPGGMVGGDSLEVDLQLGERSHALITTPGASRFYRSASEWATQSVQAHLAEGARLEWLPLETLAYPHCRGRNHLRFSMAPGAQMLGWDVLALGLPAAGQSFDAGEFEQHLEIPGLWLERGTLRGDDVRLLRSPLGLAGQGVVATLWLADGQPLERTRREALAERARECCSKAEPPLAAGVTSPSPGLMVLRVLGPRVEPVMAVLHQVWAVWRWEHWQLQPCAPRIWKM